MKRFFSVSIILLFVSSTFAYEDTDITNANFLASENIIVDQSQAPAQYRLDDKILRQEVIGMALKIKGITLPENYSCKGYYSDTKNNDWVCRAIEIAADNEMITRENATAHPGKYITRAEALAMLMNAGNMTGELSDTETPPDTPYTYDGANEWQYNILMKAEVRNIINNLETYTTEENGAIPYLIHAKFYPNREATRAEVFQFASNILAKSDTGSKYLTYSSPNEYVVEYENTMKTYTEDGVRYFEDENVIYSITKQTIACPKKTCSSTDFGIETSFGDDVTVLKTEHEEFSNSDLYTIQIGTDAFGYTRIIPDFDHKILYKLQAITYKKDFATQKTRLQRFIQSIDFYQGDDLSSFDSPSVSTKEKELIAKTADNFLAMIRIGHIKTFQEYVNQSGIEATYDEALDMLGFAKTTILQLEKLIGKKIDLGKEILSSDTEWIQEITTEGTTMDVLIYSEKYTLECRFDEVDGIWYLTGISARDPE